MRSNVLLLGALFVATACSGPGAREAERGDDVSGAALSARSACTGATMQTDECQKLRAAVLANAGEREGVITRALDWLDDGVAFDRSRTHYGFRADCSGFVANAWGESTDMEGGDAPEALDASKPLAALDDLAPGDALTNRGHVFLFGAWSDDARDGAIIIEQPHHGVAAMRAVSRTYLEAYAPIRSRLRM